MKNYITSILSAIALGTSVLACSADDSLTNSLGKPTTISLPAKSLEGLAKTATTYCTKKEADSAVTYTGQVGAKHRNGHDQVDYTLSYADNKPEGFGKEDSLTFTCSRKEGSTNSLQTIFYDPKQGKDVFQTFTSSDPDARPFHPEDAIEFGRFTFAIRNLEKYTK